MHKDTRHTIKDNFNDVETSNLDHTLAIFLIPRLEKFIELKNGYPDGETQESYDEKLNFILKSLKDYYLENDAKTSLIEQVVKIENAKKAIKILSEIWFDLWW
jgi:hypothetical protein